MHGLRWFSLLAAAVVLLEGCSAPKQKITVGSKSGADQQILGEILAQQIEARTGMQVVRRTGVGATPIVHQSLLMSDIDIYAENLGAIIANVLKEPVDPDPAVALERAKTELERVARVSVIGPMGFDAPYVVVIRASDAREKKFSTISEAASVPKPGWEVAATADFQARPDGMLALQSGYNLTMASVPSTHEPLEAYKLLKEGHVTMVMGTATDGALAGSDVVALTDDKKAFPPAQVCIFTRTEVIQKRPELAAAILELKGKLSVAAIRKLAFENEANNRPVKDLVASFLAGVK